jgi:hypothetical protein
VRNLELELRPRPAARPVVASLPGVAWTPTIQLALSSAVLAIAIVATIALGYTQLTAAEAILIGLAWVAGRRDGIVVSAMVTLGSLPYLAFVTMLAAGT